MKNKVLITIMVISLLCITGCHSNKIANEENNLLLEKMYLKEDLIGCYEKSAFVVYNKEEILTNAYYENTLRINDNNLEICYKEKNECVTMNYIYNNNNIFSLNNKDTIFFDRYDVIYFNKDDKEHNLIFRGKFDDHIRMYSYYRKVECQNES